MRLNTILTTFVVVSIAALTTGCAAEFAEESDPSLKTKSGEFQNPAEGATAAIDDRQTVAVDTKSDTARTGLDREITAYDHVIVPPTGQSTIKDKVIQVDKDEQLKRSFVAAFAQGASDD